MSWPVAFCATVCVAQTDQINGGVCIVSRSWWFRDVGRTREGKGRRMHILGKGPGQDIMGVFSRAWSWAMTLEEGQKANELNKLFLIIRSGGYLY